MAPPCCGSLRMEHAHEAWAAVAPKVERTQETWTDAGEPVRPGQQSLNPIRRVPVSVLLILFVVWHAGLAVLAGLLVQDGGMQAVDHMLDILTVEVQEGVARHIDHVFKSWEQVASLLLRQAAHSVVPRM